MSNFSGSYQKWHPLSYFNVNWLVIQQSQYRESTSPNYQIAKNRIDLTDAGDIEMGLGLKNNSQWEKSKRTIHSYINRISCLISNAYAMYRACIVWCVYTSFPANTSNFKQLLNLTIWNDTNLYKESYPMVTYQRVTFIVL